MQHQLTTAELQYLTKKLAGYIDNMGDDLKYKQQEVSYFMQIAGQNTDIGRCAFKLLNINRTEYRKCKRNLNKLSSIQTKLKRQLAEQSKQQQEDNSWIVWEGGECPVVDKVQVDVKLRNGEIYCAESDYEELFWGCCDIYPEFDIIAYRINKPKK